MQTAPRFETTLPRDFFAPPPKPPPPVKPQSPSDWRTLQIVGICAVAFVATVYILRPHPSPVTAPSAAPAPIFSPHSTLPSPRASILAPEVRRAQLVLAPRAQLVAIPVGTTYSTLMPDGQSVTVRYMGILGSFDALPRNPVLGDMWSIPQSGHPWVWYQPPGFTHPAWVDP